MMNDHFLLRRDDVLAGASASGSSSSSLPALPLRIERFFEPLLPFDLLFLLLDDVPPAAGFGAHWRARSASNFLLTLAASLPLTKIKCGQAVGGAYATVLQFDLRKGKPETSNKSHQSKLTLPFRNAIAVAALLAGGMAMFVSSTNEIEAAAAFGLAGVRVLL